MPEITFGSLFSGIGGIDLGLERAGMTCKWQVEIDAFCNAVLQQHWPDTPRFGDIKELSGDELEAVDLIAGGFPCQPVSLAGKGQAQKDARWLWPEFERIVRMVRPSYVLVENVPGLAQRGLHIVLGSLAEMGFDAEWQVVSAASVGAPHIRERIFVVAWRANADSHRCQRLSQSHGTTVEPQPQGTQRHDTHGLRVAVADSEVFPEWAGLRPNESPSEWWRRLGYRSGSNETWAVEPDVGRVAHGVPARLDRLRALGNAVVPQVAEFVGSCIVRAMKTEAMHQQQERQ